MIDNSSTDYKPNKNKAKNVDRYAVKGEKVNLFRIRSKMYFKINCKRTTFSCTKTTLAY